MMMLAGAGSRLESGHFPHFDVGDVFGVEQRLVGRLILLGTGAAALLPVGTGPERPAGQAGHDVQDRDGDGGRCHKNERHQRAEDGQYQEKQVAEDLSQCVHYWVEPLQRKKFLAIRYSCGVDDLRSL